MVFKRDRAKSDDRSGYRVGLQATVGLGWVEFGEIDSKSWPTRIINNVAVGLAKKLNGMPSEKFEGGGAK